MRRLTIGSLFSGIGGLELGLEWAGLGPVLWQVEKDPYCLKVLEKHWPDVKRYEDVRTVGSGNLERVDLICGGFPCQDISCAGRGAGIKKGTRSGLWYEFARIISELRPKFIIVENVPALLGRGMGIVCGDLAALGYGAWYDCIPAQSVGAPHRRDRVFIVAYPQRSKRWKSKSARDEPNWNYARWDQKAGRVGAPSANGRTETLADTDEGRRDGWTWMQLARWRRKPSNGNWWSVEPDVGRVAHGVPHRVDRLRALGNAVVPQVAQVIGEIVKELAHA